jgi:raffinose/stachyose/melibiose transport system permease protein
MYDKAFRGSMDFPVANAISTIMIIISFVLIGITQFIEKRFASTED